MSLTKVYSALERMRELSSSNVPFSFSFWSYSEKRGESNGLKQISRAVLRTGLSSKISDKSEILIAYTDLDSGNPGFAYLPLILTFNNCDLK
jgi:hypothetical protein